ncbi:MULTISPECIES: glycosyltransferase [unclassified Blautia]|nr:MULTISPECIES: glycosyltransferase [unclassified Blautia]
MVRCYGAFVIFRCPMTDTLREFATMAKQMNKPLWYDVDDLVIDTKYTDQIPFLDRMQPEERQAYDQNVRNMGELLSLCDAAVTTTAALAEELKQYVPEVLINRNCASDEMLLLSEAVLKEKQKKNEADGTAKKVRLGYFSGSATHLDDIEMIVPVLKQLLGKNPNLELLIVGILELPVELKLFASQIQMEGFVDYQKLPERIASVDINLAPLTDTIFNRAKSENKWVEAALVQTVTAASNLGAFAEMVQDGEDGVLCRDEAEWLEKLQWLIDDEPARKAIAGRAYGRCSRECVTIFHATGICEWVERHWNLRCAFVLPAMEISGGIRVALLHAEMLVKAGAQVSLFTLEGEAEWYHEGDFHFPVLSAEREKLQGTLDLAVATMWNTAEFVEQSSKIRKKKYLVQNFEVGFYPPGSPYRIATSATYRMRSPMEYVTISKWCQNWLREEYHTEAAYLPNGIDPSFYPKRGRDLQGKIRILIEGDCSAEHKNVDESFRIVEQLDLEKFEIWYMSYNGNPKSWYRVDRFLHRVPYEKTPEVYAACDILLKTSLLESFSYPPLEMMASGGYVVAVPNGGNLEYLKDGENCILYPQGNLAEAKAAIERILTDAELRKKLDTGAEETVKERNWKRIEPQILEQYLGK